MVATYVCNVGAGMPTESADNIAERRRLVALIVNSPGNSMPVAYWAARPLDELRGIAALIDNSATALPLPRTFDPPGSMDLGDNSDHAARPVANRGRHAVDDGLLRLPKTF